MMAQYHYKNNRELTKMMIVIIMMMEVILAPLISLLEERNPEENFNFTLIMLHYWIHKSPELPTKMRS